MYPDGFVSSVVTCTVVFLISLWAICACVDLAESVAYGKDITFFKKRKKKEKSGSDDEGHGEDVDDESEIRGE